MTGRYALSGAVLAETFEREIRRALFGVSRPEAAPVAVLLGGQPGAGKTRATAEVEHSFGRRLTSIIGDDLRIFHPAYEELIARSPALMTVETGQASGAWVRMAIDYARDNRLSVLVEGTFRRPEITLAEAERFHTIGFSTHLVALSVPAAASRLSTFSRYVSGVRATGEARWTPLEAHEAGFVGTPRTVAAAEASPFVDRITVLNRAGVAGYDERRDGIPLEGAVQAVEAGRLAPLGAGGALLWLRDFHDALAYLSARAGVDEKMLPLLAQLTVDAEPIISAAHPDERAAGRKEAETKLASTRRNLRALLPRPVQDASATRPVIAHPTHGLGLSL